MRLKPGALGLPHFDDPQDFQVWLEGLKDMGEDGSRTLRHCPEILRPEQRHTWYPTSMKKTSIYLADVDRERLCRLAAREGKSQAHVVREALALYDASRPDRNFEI